jgi:hypothetical protein
MKHKDKTMGKKIIKTAQFITAAAFAVVIITFIPKACTRPDSAAKLLTQQGYTEIKITGWRPMMAGKDESVSTGFEATSPNGQRVSGAITSGLLFKGSTIRFD